MSDLKGLEEQRGVKHLHPVFRSPITLRHKPNYSRLFQALTALVFPWHRFDYPGKTAALANALGYTVSTAIAGVKGDVTPPMALRAEKFCRDMARELVSLADQFASEARKLEAAKAGKSRGMLDVRVREPGGEPRTAIYSQHCHTHYADIHNPRRAGKNSSPKNKPNPF